jgi:hypothetical protein
MATQSRAPWKNTLMGMLLTPVAEKVSLSAKATLMKKP